MFEPWAPFWLGRSCGSPWWHTHARSLFLGLWGIAVAACVCISNCCVSSLQGIQPLLPGFGPSGFLFSEALGGKVLVLRLVPPSRLFHLSAFLVWTDQPKQVCRSIHVVFLNDIVRWLQIEVKQKRSDLGTVEERSSSVYFVSSVFLPRTCVLSIWNGPKLARGTARWQECAPSICMSIYLYIGRKILLWSLESPPVKLLQC